MVGIHKCFKIQVVKVIANDTFKSVKSCIAAEANRSWRGLEQLLRIPATMSTYKPAQLI